MPKNKKGGNKAKRGGNKFTNRKEEEGTVELAEQGQIYAQIKKRLGGSHILVECSDGQQRQAVIPGRMKKGRRGQWLNHGDVILCHVEKNGQTEDCIIDKKYSPAHVKILLSRGIISFEGTIHEEEEEQPQEDADIFDAPEQTNSKRLDLTGIDDDDFDDLDDDDEEDTDEDSDQDDSDDDETKPKSGWWDN